jgi:hypothetical protein
VLAAQDKRARTIVDALGSGSRPKTLVRPSRIAIHNLARCCATIWDGVLNRVVSTVFIGKEAFACDYEGTMITGKNAVYFLPNQALYHAEPQPELD